VNSGGHNSDSFAGANYLCEETALVRPQTAVPSSIGNPVYATSFLVCKPLSLSVDSKRIHHGAAVTLAYYYLENKKLCGGDEKTAHLDWYEQ